MPQVFTEYGGERLSRYSSSMMSRLCALQKYALKPSDLDIDLNLATAATVVGPSASAKDQKKK